MFSTPTKKPVLNVLKILFAKPIKCSNILTKFFFLTDVGWILLLVIRIAFITYRKIE